MRKLFLIIALLPSVAVAAEQQKRPAAPPKKASPVGSTANPCAQYGAGFVQVQGSNTCVKLSGSVRVEVGR